MKRSAPLIVIMLLAFFTTVFAQDRSTPSPTSDDAAISATETSSDHKGSQPLSAPKSLKWGSATLIIKDEGGNIISTMTGKYPIGKAMKCTWVSCNCQPNPGGTIHCDLCCQ